jgi:hypothetical protein
MDCRINSNRRGFLIRNDYLFLSGNRSGTALSGISIRSRYFSRHGHRACQFFCIGIFSRRCTCNLLGVRTPDARSHLCSGVLLDPGERHSSAGVDLPAVFISAYSFLTMTLLLYAGYEPIRGLLYIYWLFGMPILGLSFLARAYYG